MSIFEDMRIWAGLVALTLTALGCGDPSPPSPAAGETFCKTANCDDKNACTKDTCDPKAGKCDNSTPDDGKTCDDGDKCTADDACKMLKCQGTAKNCSDDDVCTLGDKCNPDDGKCVPGKAKDCDDVNKCTADTCDPVEGCKNKPNTDACDDNDACTEKDKCVDKACKGVAVTADDGDPCTTDACSASGGVTHVANSADCDDKNPCTVGDKCSDKKCVGGAAKACDDNNLCTDDSCDATTGTCKSVNNSKPCDDSSACTQDDMCDAGACKGTEVKTEDGNPCTDDACDKKAGVTHVANTVSCEDGKICTVGDKCADKACVPGPAKYCDETDGNACTEPECIEGAGGCKEVKVKDNTPCNDNDKCTNDDKCGGGVCLPGTATPCNGDGNLCKDWACDPKVGCTSKAAQKGKTCDDGDACTKNDTCDTGACLPGQLSTCQDGNPCTDDSCDKKLGCAYVPNSQPCDDKDACTVGDMCKSGACAPGTVTSCDDKNPCTIDQCDKATGKCGTQASTDGTLCEDASLCTNDTVCKTGQCAGGTKVVCKDDGNPCTSDACSDALGCKFPAQDGVCDADDSVCTPKDFCSAGKCVADSIKSCDDNNPCTDDVCDKLKDCLNTPNSAKCDDGLMCTVGDTCKGGSCSLNTPKNCSDGNDCTEDSCDAKTGCGSVNSLLGSSCSDGDACSTGDGCDGKGACKSTGPALWTLKDGTSLQDRYFGAAVGPDGTIVSVGSMYTGLPVVAKLTGRKPDKSIAFETKLQKAGSEQWLNAIQPAPKGRYIAVGQADVDNTGWTAYRNYAVQINANGVIEWEYAGKPSGYASYFSDVAVAPTGAVAMVGVAYGAPNGYLAAATSAESNWIPDLVDQQYPPPSGFKAQYFRAVAHAPAGGYWVGGMILYGSNNGGAARILRIQPGGGVTFDKVFGKDNGSWQNSYHLVADKDGVTSFGDSTNGIYGGEDSWIVRIDNNNKVVYEVHLGGAGNDSIRNAIAAPDGGFIVAGYSTLTGENLAKAFLGRVDSSGLLEWQRTLNQPDSRWRGIALTPTGSFAVAGYTNFETKGDNDTLLATCDLYGNCDCASSGTCLTKATAACDDKNPCTLDWCDKGTCQHANGNENQMCDTNSTTKTCQKGKCL